MDWLHSSDNIGRAEFGVADGSYDSLGLLLNLGHTSRRLDASVDSDLERRSYSIDAIHDETVGALDAVALVDLVVDRFRWMFSEEYGQGSADPFVATRPGNRESLNVVSTGPRVDIPVAERTMLALTGDYSERRYDVAIDADSNLTEYELGLLRQIRRSTQVGLIANNSHTDYTEVDAPSYEIDSLAFRYFKTLATGTVTADVGTNEISSSGGSRKKPLVNFAWTRDLTGRSELGVVAARQFTDSGGLLALGDDSIDGSPILAAPSPVEEQRLTVSYLLTMERTVVSGSVGASEYRYFGDTVLDNDANEIQLAYTRTVSPQLAFGVNYNKVFRDFNDPATFEPHDEDATLSAWLSKSLGRNFGVAFGVSEYVRSGPQSFDERRYEVRFLYSPIGDVNVGDMGR